MVHSHVCGGVALFIGGTVFCYALILNPAVQWLTDQANGFANIFPDAKAWIDVIINFELAFGFAFELPLVVFYLVVFEIIPYAKLRNSWRTVYIVLMVISAMVTLDASPVTMLMMFAALLMLAPDQLACRPFGAGQAREGAEGRGRARSSRRGRMARRMGPEKGCH